MVLIAAVFQEVADSGLGSVALEMVWFSLSRRTRSLYFPGTVHPTRYPGARDLLNELQSSTLPLRSYCLQLLGRSLPKYRSA